MDKFPQHFNRSACNEIMEKCQIELVKNIRQTFYESINKSVNDCMPQVTLEFPDNLWDEHRMTLIKELLERFGKLKIQIVSEHILIKLVTHIDNVPSGVKNVIIEFIK